MIFKKLANMNPANSSATRYVSNATGATWALTNTDRGDDLAGTIRIVNDSTTDHAAKTALLTGTDADGKAQTETLNLPGNAGTVNSLKHFLTLATVVPSETIGSDTMDIGTAGDDVVSPTIPLDYRSRLAAVVASVKTGTVGWDYEVTFDYVNRPNEFTWDNQGSAVWHPSASLTADASGTVLDVGATAIRVRITSYTDTAELQAWVTQIITPV